MGHGIALSLIPVVSRLYAPSQFGTFSSVAAIAAVFVGLSTFRLEVLAQGTTDDMRADRLQRLALVTALGWGLVVTAGCTVVVVAKGVTPYLLTAGPLVAVASLQLIGAARLTRGRRYRDLARGNLLQGAGTALLQVGFGMVSAAAGSLLAAFAIARLAWLPALRRSPLDRERPTLPLVDAWRESRRYAVVSGSAAALNSLATQLPLLLCTYLYGQVEVGLLAMAIRLLVSPMSIIGQAAAAASVGEIGRRIRLGSPGTHTIVTRGMLYLLALGALPCAAAAVTAPVLVPIVLGQAWAPVGPLVAWLAVGTLGQFAVAPFSQLLNLTGRHVWMLRWDASRLVVIAAAIGVPATLGQSLHSAVAIYSGCSLVLYAFLGVACARAAQSTR